MKNRVAGAVGAAALVLATAGVSPAGAQVVQRGGDFLTLVGPGSTIGVNVEDVSADEASKAKLNQAEGVVVREVQSGSPASRAGFRSGDIVVEFDGERVRSVRQFQRLVQETPPNRTVKATVVRGGSRQTLDVTPEAGRAGSDLSRITPFELPNLRIQPAPPGTRREFQLTPRPFATPSQGRLGVSITPVDGQLASYFGVKSGALVASVSPNSAAEAAGLRAGDVITAVGGRTVSTPEDVTEAVRTAEPGSVLELTVTRDKKSMQLKATMPAADQPSRDSDRIRL
jgi:serine protease Do